MNNDDDQAATELEFIMLQMLHTDPVKFGKMCGSMGVDASEFAEFLKHDTKNQTN